MREICTSRPTCRLLSKPRRDAPLHRYLVWNRNIGQRAAYQYEDCGLALGIVAVESSLPATFLY
jgi:hypothetical protein